MAGFGIPGEQAGATSHATSSSLAVLEDGREQTRHSVPSAKPGSPFVYLRVFFRYSCVCVRNEAIISNISLSPRFCWTPHCSSHAKENPASGPLHFLCPLPDRQLKFPPLILCSHVNCSKWPSLTVPSKTAQLQHSLNSLRSRPS